jgi:transposase InsO family protein
MRQTRNTTQEERIQIARECIASGKNYGELAIKYNVSYQQVRTWTLRFEELGEAGLEDRRGKRKKDQTPRTELEKAGMTQSMSRVAKCIDNGAMEGFWGILKREKYYGRRFTSREGLAQMIRSYITYYNNHRVQHNLGVLTPMEKHQQCLLAA